MLALGLLSYNVLPKYYGAQAATVTMEAIGHKWDFEFRYPGLKQSVFNDLYLPVNVPVTMDITSSEVKEEDARHPFLLGPRIPGETRHGAGHGRADPFHAESHRHVPHHLHGVLRAWSFRDVG